MQSLIEIMVNAFQSCKEAGSYFVFYIIALGLGLTIALDRSGKVEMGDNWMVEEAKKEIQLWPFLYGGLALLLVAANPVVVFIMDKVSPVSGQYYKIWSLLLLLFLCAYGIVCFLSILREKHHKKIIVIGFIVLIGLAGSGYGIMAERHSKVDFAEEEQVLQLVQSTGEDIILLATDHIMEYAGVYYPQIQLLYGKDLYTSMDLGIIDTYAPELLGLYEAMKNPQECMGEIANVAAMFDCDAIVVGKFDKSPDKAGSYYKRHETEEYFIYAR